VRRYFFNHCVAPSPQFSVRSWLGCGKRGVHEAFGVALILSLSLFGAERVLAADLPAPGSAPIPPNSYYPVSQPINWGGVYIGLNGGYGLGSSNWSDSSAAAAVLGRRTSGFHRPISYRRERNVPVGVSPLIANISMLGPSVCCNQNGSRAIAIYVKV
jgi:hypothetical protein